MSGAMGKHASVESPQDENAMPLPTQHSRPYHNAERRSQSQQQQHLLLHPHHRHQPTELILCIRQQKYSEAIRRIYLCPKEASVWACGKRKILEDDSIIRRAKSPSHRLTNLSKNRLLPKPPRRQRDSGVPVRYAIFQLPIHVACEHLKKHGNGTTPKAHLETLIAHLAAVYPKGCEKREHHGFLPLHLALKHQASPRTITVLLCAAPCTIRELDPSGLTPLELHQIHLRGPDEEEVVQQLLARDEDFWNAARCEAVLRLKRRRIPAEDDTIGSLTVLAASEGVAPSESDAEHCPSDTSRTEDSSTYAVPVDGGSGFPSSTTAAAAPAPAPRHLWCAGRLGHALAESYSKIHELGLSISALKAALQDIETQYQDAGTAQSLGLRILDLEVEKDRLHRHVAQLSRELEKCRMEQVSSKPPSSLEQNETLLRLSQERDELRLEVEALKAKNGQYQDLLLLYETKRIRPLEETHTKCDNPVENYELPPSEVGSKSDDLDSVMLYASQFCGHRLRQELVDAWKGASLGGISGTFASDYDISDLGSSEPTSDVQRESNAMNGSFTSHGNLSRTPM